MYVLGEAEQRKKKYWAILGLISRTINCGLGHKSYDYTYLSTFVNLLQLNKFNDFC